MFPEVKNIPIQKIESPFLQEKEVQLYMLRLDKVHPYISGNKWFKLKYNLEEAKSQGKKTLLTFGGAYSNHIIAVAAAGREYGFKTVGVIRGEELSPAYGKVTSDEGSAVAKAMADEGGEQSANQVREQRPNPVLEFAENCGMELKFMSREEYRKKDASLLLSMTGDIYIIPEGGTNELAVKGCAEIVSLIDIPFDHICCAVGTGGTIAGIISSLKEKQKAIGFPVLKGGEFLKEEIEKLVPGKTNYELQTAYHFGGYAKKDETLMKFINDFKANYNIPLDFVYTGKMMYGIFDLVKKNYFPKRATIIAIHTGGISISTV